MHISHLLDCSPERVTLFVAARFAGRAAADERFTREKEGEPSATGIYIPNRIEEDKAAKIEFAISYLIRLKELREQTR